jgi:hypothetical protein
MMLPWYFVSQPDEWLLCIRNGRLVKAGVGISLWSRPFDVVVRFTSTVQRVRFTREELDRQKAVQLAELEQEEVRFQAKLDRIRREAEANRDAIAAVASAEEQKSPGARDHELSRLVAEKVGDALKALPLKDARWVTVGPETPAGSLVSLIEATRGAISR